jgi:tRNA G10  N-methylase Trm11
MQFRHIEFQGALSAVLGGPNEHEPLSIHFRDALNYAGSADMSAAMLVCYNNAMQYVTAPDNVPRQALVEAVERCALIHALYEVVAEAETYVDLAALTMTSDAFDDMKRGSGQANEKCTWCFRARHYGEISGSTKEKRSGARARSMKVEKEVLRALEPLLLEFGGKVNLEEPDCKIYAFDGIESAGGKVLAREIASGPRVSIIKPNTRICVTNTPLCPIAAFALCNVAGVRAGQSILDPYAGSCATFLSAAMMEPTCRMVGIEISHNGMVNRDDIRKDFSTRNLVEPLALLLGDSTDESLRDEARSFINDEPFDHIITDPPYGIRESKGYNEMSPIDELLKSIKSDRENGKRLLKKGGRLVSFIPCHEDEENLDEAMPTSSQLEEAGLVCEMMREQPLNEKLSRWLVSYLCIA